MVRSLSLVLLLLSAHPLFAVTRRWTGATSANWSDPSNWSPAGVPAAADRLEFPPESRHVMTNDLQAGSAFGPMAFYSGSYSISGSAMTLVADVQFEPAVTVTWNTDLTIGASLRIGDPAYPSSAGSTFNGVLDVNGRTLTLLGDGTKINGPLVGKGELDGNKMTIAGDSDFTGVINASVEIHGVLPNVEVHGGLSGEGTVGGAVYVPSACFPRCELSPNQSLSTGALSVNGNQIVHLAPGGISDAVHVTGTVAVSGNLSVSMTGTPVPGQTFTLIDNDGTDAVTGTYFRMLERTIVNVNGFPFRLSYKGGDGNDVVLLATAPTSTEIGQSAATTKYGEPWTMTATVNSPSGTPTGEITFVVDGKNAGTAPLQNGTASLTLTGLAPGSHPLVTLYVATGSFSDNASPPATHQVTNTISIHGAHVVEGAAGTTTTVSLPVTLAAAGTAPVRVSFATVAGSAEEGRDYEKASGVVEFAPGEQTKSIELHVLGDDVAEGEKTFSVVLFDPVNATIESSSAAIVIDERGGRRRAVHH